MPHLATLEKTQVRPLTKYQIQYAEGRALGKDRCKKHPKWDKLPQVQQAIHDIQSKSRALIAYDLSIAMADCDKAADLSYACNQPMALVKAFELKAKLAGLLIEKHEILTVSLTEALAEAKRRAESRKTLDSPLPGPTTSSHAVILVNSANTETPTPAQ